MLITPQRYNSAEQKADLSIASVSDGILENTLYLTLKTIYRTAQNTPNTKFEEPAAMRAEVLVLLRKVSNELNGPDYYR